MKTRERPTGLSPTLFEARSRITRPNLRVIHTCTSQSSRCELQFFPADLGPNRPASKAAYYRWTFFSFLCNNCKLAESPPLGAADPSRRCRGTSPGQQGNVCRRLQCTLLCNIIINCFFVLHFTAYIFCQSLVGI